MTATIDLIRHGEPVGGTKYRGHTDDALSEIGFRQMWDAIGEAYPWQHIVTSPLRRCAQFAAALSARAGIPVSTDARLKEMSFGQWEGQTPEQVRSASPDAVRRFYENPLNFPPPGGEKLKLFAARVMAAWYELIGSRGGSHVLVVAHGAVIRVVLAHVLDMPLNDLFRLEVDYAAVSRIRVPSDGTRVTVAFHNGKAIVAYD